MAAIGAEEDQAALALVRVQDAPVLVLVVVDNHVAGINYQETCNYSATHE